MECKSLPFKAKMSHQICETGQELSLLAQLILVWNPSLLSHCYKCLILLSFHLAQVWALVIQQVISFWVHLSIWKRPSVYQCNCLFLQIHCAEVEHEAIARSHHTQYLTSAPFPERWGWFALMVLVFNPYKIT